MRIGRNLLAGVLLVVALSATGASALAHGSRVPAVPMGTFGASSAPYHPVLAAGPAAAPVNDDWATATPISGASGSASGSNLAATVETGEPVAPKVADSVTATGMTVWWKWTAPATGNYVFDTATSALEDTVLAVYTGSSVATLAQGQVAGSDDTDDVQTSRVAFDAVSAGVYYVQVGSYNGETAGSIGLAWRVNPIANDSFTHRTTISGATGSTSSTNAGATLDLDEPRGGVLLDASVWYSWTAAADGDLTLTLNSGFAGWLAAYTGTAVGALAPLVQQNGSSPVTARFRATAGTTYAIQIAATRADELPGSFALGWSLVGVPGSPSLNAATPGDASVALAWTAPSSIGGGPVTGYKVYRGTDTGDESLLATLGNATTFNDTNLLNGVTYWYQVTALNSLGEGLPSNEVSAMPIGAPDAPTLAVPTAGDGSVSLTWSAPGSDGGATITKYKIYRGTSSGGEAPVAIDEVGAVTGYTDNTVSNFTTYFYKVTALNAIGESVRSNERSVTPAPPATLPGEPVLSQPTPGVGSVTLDWTTPVTGGSPIAHYNIYRGASPGGETLFHTTGVANTYTDTAVTNGTLYYYKVKAVNGVGEGGFSEERNMTPLLSAPTLNTAVAGFVNVLLSWSAPTLSGDVPIGSYNVYRSSAGSSEAVIASPDGSATGYNDTTAVTGTTYTYTVAAVNFAGEGARSSSLVATPSSIPSAPTAISVTAGNGSVTVVWSAPSSNGSPITGYRIYRAAGADNIGGTPQATVGNVTTYTDTAVTNGTIYDYYVKAVNAVGEGIQSAFVTAVPAPGAYGAPSWWNGDCDASWWNPQAALLGWPGEGAHRLGAAYLGIPVCGPRVVFDGAPLVPWTRAGQPVSEWGSPEYAFRFMAQVYGVNAYAAAPKDVARSYTSGAGGGLQFVANGTPGSAPQPGDVISFDNPDNIGLVAVVAWSSVNGSGTGDVRVLGQNDAGGGWRRLTVTNWVVQPLNANTPNGWLHDPQGRGTGSGAPPFATPSRAPEPPANAGPRTPVPDFTPPTGPRPPVPSLN